MKQNYIGFSYRTKKVYKKVKKICWNGQVTLFALNDLL